MLLRQTSCSASDGITPEMSKIDCHTLHIKSGHMKSLEGPKGIFLAGRIFLQADIHLNCPMKPATCDHGRLHGHGMAF